MNMNETHITKVEEEESRLKILLGRLEKLKQSLGDNSSASPEQNLEFIDIGANISDSFYWLNREVADLIQNGNFPDRSGARFSDGGYDFRGDDLSIKEKIEIAKNFCNEELLGEKLDNLKVEARKQDEKSAATKNREDSKLGDNISSLFNGQSEKGKDSSKNQLQ